MNIEDFVSVREAASILGVKRARIYKLISQQRIPGVVVHSGVTLVARWGLAAILPGKHKYPIAVGHKAEG